MVKIKICGITNLEDALHAVECGADMLGFNFYEKSPRCIAPGAVANIMEKVRARADRVVAVGVFVNEELGRVHEVAVRSDIDVFQLHGDESPAYVDSVGSDLGLAVIKAFQVNAHFDISVIDDYDVSAVLLDGFSEKKRGGTGTVADWGIARSAVERGMKVYLAGGLSPDNVADAIRNVRPFAVDACSSLESDLGRKDHDKVRRFVENLRKVDE